MKNQILKANVDTNRKQIIYVNLSCLYQPSSISYFIASELKREVYRRDHHQVVPRNSYGMLITLYDYESDCRELFIDLFDIFTSFYEWISSSWFLQTTHVLAIVACLFVFPFALHFQLIDFRTLFLNTYIIWDPEPKCLSISAVIHFR